MKHALVLLISLGLSSILPAGEGDGRDHGHTHDAIVVPSSLAGIRAEIDAQRQKLAEALAARDAAGAHAATDSLQACVRAIPGATVDLDQATRQRVAGMANNAAKAWGEAAHKAEDGDYANAQREADKAAASYGLLEARLPRD